MFNPKALLRRFKNKFPRATGNRALPKEVQKEIMAKAEAKRERRRNRGW